MLRVFIALVVLSGAVPSAQVQAAGDSDSWIVQLRDGASLARTVARARERHAVAVERIYSTVLRGFSARLTPAQREALSRDPSVAAVVRDQRIQVDAVQPVPPGVRRVGASPSAVRAVDGSDPVLDVDIAILDSGVGPHADLNIAGGYNCTTSNTAAWNDQYGHGTHVAGIAAARDNSFGVVGVAPGARVWSVKVVDQTGVGLISWLACGLDWVASRSDPAKPAVPLFEVLNMSLSTNAADDGNCGVTSTPAAYDLLHQAICRVNRAGIAAVVSAGNLSLDASHRVPAAYSETITVGAICDSDGRPGSNGNACSRGNPDDSFASFSNYGRAVDLVAPGVTVRSSLPGGYGVMSGTSMSAPHVAGGAALYHLRERALGRPRPTPEDVRAGLVATGSTAWRRATYPLGAAAAPPLLDVSRLDPGPGFTIGAGPASRRAGVGETVFFDAWIGRTGGFNGAVELTLEGAPSGATWTVGPPTVAASSSSWRRLELQLPASGATGSYELSIVGTAGTSRRSAPVTLHFEGTFMAGNDPRLNLRPANVPGNYLPTVVIWPRVAGASQYELAVSRNDGGWSTLARQKGTSYATSAWPRATYRYRVRAMVNGEWQGWQTSRAYVATPLMAHDGVAALSGQWTHTTLNKSFSEKISYSTQAGARLRLDFTGRSVSWIASRGPNRGRANVYLDGARVATVDLYASSVSHRHTIFRRSWATPGAHRLEIEVLGTSGRPRVDVDAIVFVSAR
jgi:subtilisin